MSALPESFWSWVGIALLLFWFVGAHNRLVRLRSAALVAFAALDAALVRQFDYVQSRTDAAPAGQEGYAALVSANAQMAAMLAVTRLRPLEAGRVQAMGTALQVLLTAWERAHPGEGVHFDADGTLSRPAALEPMAHPDRPAGGVPLAWPEPSAAAEIARGQFNHAVAQYNRAIGQFPALIVAWAFRLRPAAPLV